MWCYCRKIRKGIQENSSIFVSRMTVEMLYVADIAVSRTNTTEVVFAFHLRYTNKREIFSQHKSGNLGSKLIAFFLLCHRQTKEDFHNEKNNTPFKHIVEKLYCHYE